MKPLRSDQSGFTLPELITVMIVSTLFSALVLFFGINYWRYGYLQEADLSTLVTRLNAQDYLRENISTSSGLIIQNSLPDTHSTVVDPLFVSGEYWKPIHAIPGTTTLGTTGASSLLYYKRFSVNSSNAYIMNGTQPYEDEFILYLDNPTKQLRVRALANPNAIGNKLKTSCPPALASDTCPADKVVADNLSSVAIRYFSRSGNPIDWTSLYDSVNATYIGPDYPNVEVVEFTLNMTVRPVFQKANATQNTTVIRIALRNT
jgi:prepilin-type N-terminal cleavage/methylation domain-containing protein